MKLTRELSKTSSERKQMFIRILWSIALVATYCAGMLWYLESTKLPLPGDPMFIGPLWTKQQVVYHTLKRPQAGDTLWIEASWAKDSTNWNIND